MFITVITDCCDDNAKGRQTTAWSSLFDSCNLTLVGGSHYLEVSGHLVDCILAGRGRPGIIFANCAPRDGQGNGVDFGFFWHEKTLVLSSMNEGVMLLPRKLGITQTLTPLPVDDIAPQIGDDRFAELCRQTQFRSLEYVPQVAQALWRKDKLDLEQPRSFSCPYGAAPFVWYIDCFGNIKLTSTAEDIRFHHGKVFTINGNTVTCVEGSLKEVPHDQLSMIVGSSGGHRLLEIVIRGGNANEVIKTSPGNQLLSAAAVA